MSMYKNYFKVPLSKANGTPSIKEVMFEGADGVQYTALQFEGYASTKDLDRGGDIVLPEAFLQQLPEFMQNAMVLLQHDHDKPIGQIISAKVDDTGLYVVGQVRVDVDDVFKKVRTGVIKTMSIGFSVEFDDIDFEEVIIDGVSQHVTIIKKLNLYEISLVSVPMNPKAQIKDVDMNSIGKLPDAEYAKLYAINKKDEYTLYKSLKDLSKKAQEDAIIIKAEEEEQVESEVVDTATAEAVANEANEGGEAEVVSEETKDAEDVVSETVAEEGAIVEQTQAEPAVEEPATVEPVVAVEEPTTIEETKSIDMKKGVNAQELAIGMYLLYRVSKPNARGDLVVEPNLDNQPYIGEIIDIMIDEDVLFDGEVYTATVDNPVVILERYYVINDVLVATNITDTDKYVNIIVDGTYTQSSIVTSGLENMETKEVSSGEGVAEVAVDALPTEDAPVAIQESPEATPEAETTVAEVVETETAEEGEVKIDKAITNTYDSNNKSPENGGGEAPVVTDGLYTKAMEVIENQTKQIEKLTNETDSLQKTLSDTIESVKGLTEIVTTMSKAYSKFIVKGVPVYKQEVEKPLSEVGMAIQAIKGGVL